MIPYKRIDRQLMKKGHIIDIYQDTIELPDGQTMEWDFIMHKGAAAIVPMDEDGRIIMVKQYRNAIDAYTLEIPAGGLNPGEDMKTCAMRECEEETGYKALDAIHLFDLNTTVAFCNEKIGIYFTRNLIPSKQNLDEGEYVFIERYTIDELMEKIQSGEITDAKTIAGLTTVKLRLLKGTI